MNIKVICKKAVYILSVFFLALFCLFESTLSITAKADDSINYSDVLTDLRKDENFNIDDYPDLVNDYSLQVIQIAESENNELFLYVYQPSHRALDLLCTTISMYNGYSTNGKDFSPLLYELELVSTDGVFDKYVVKDYIVSTEGERWYNIVSIYRAFNETIDKHIEGGITDEIAYSVGQQWHVYYMNDEMYYEMGTFKTLEVEIVTAGNIEYSNGFTMGSLAGLYNYCDSHFVCFNVPDYVVSHIYDADVSYVSRPVTEYSGMGVPDDSYGEYETKYVTLYDNDVVTFEGSGWLGKTYNWNRISSSTDFVKNFENQGGVLGKTSIDRIASSQWVFAFCETEIDVISSNGWTIVSSTEVSKVTILRLHFVDITGRYYNLGVVADRVTEDDITDGVAGGLDFDRLWEKILKAIIIAVGLILLCVTIPWLLVFVFKLLIAAIKLVFRLISALFKWIGSWFKKKK